MEKTIQFSPEPIKWYLTKPNNHTVLPYASAVEHKSECSGCCYEVWFTAGGVILNSLNKIIDPNNFGFASTRQCMQQQPPPPPLP